VKVYVASPLCLSEVGRAYFYGTLIPYLASAECEAFDPWKLAEPAKIETVCSMPYGPARREAWKALSWEIGKNNEAAIRGAELIFAVLDGADVESGTAAEIGFAFAHGKTILGYRGDVRLAANNEGTTVSLQVEYFIRKSGGTIIARLDELTEAVRAVKSRLVA
jgi:nucleoside 2-deoxyribosyltransferase